MRRRTFLRLYAAFVLLLLLSVATNSELSRKAIDKKANKLNKLAMADRAGYNETLPDAPECVAARDFRKAAIETFNGGDPLTMSALRHAENSLAHLVFNEEYRIAFCLIQKNGSSEWGKFFNRMVGENYRQESFIHHPKTVRKQIKQAGPDGALEWFNSIVRDPTWNFGIFLRDPIKRLQSVYLMIFHSGERRGGFQRYREKFNLTQEEELSFAQFIDKVTDPVDPIGNIHWRRQSQFCGARDHLGLFNFVGNFEDMSRQSELFLKCTNTWEDFGKDGWGLYANASFFHRGSSNAVHATASLDHALLAEVTPDIREKVRRFYREDYELNMAVRSPLYNPAIWEG